MSRSFTVERVFKFPSIASHNGQTRCQFYSKQHGHEHGMLLNSAHILHISIHVYRRKNFLRARGHGRRRLRAQKLPSFARGGTGRGGGGGGPENEEKRLGTQFFLQTSQNKMYRSVIKTKLYPKDSYWIPTTVVNCIGIHQKFISVKTSMGFLIHLQFGAGPHGDFGKSRRRKEKARLEIENHERQGSTDAIRVPFRESTI